tara:strand:+ start:182 stop:664 length:483 start_codon:yes stop_codon:yes gene_type:complete
MSGIDLKDFLANSDDYVDNTNKLREKKHGKLIKEAIQDIEEIRAETGDLYKKDIEMFKNKCTNKNTFLYNNYFDIFNKVCTQEISLTIMDEFISVLRSIEEGLLDQHEGSVKIGELLKRLYVDSALRKGENIDKINPTEVKVFKESKDISWKQYKNMNIE